MHFVVGIIIGILIGYVLILIRDKRATGKYLATTEYWVYLPDEKLPPQDEVMKLLLGGSSPVGPEEGLLLSDIRLHIGLVLRSKNPHVFRPDLFEDHLEPTAELLNLMSRSKSIAKLRYLSEIKLKNDAHLQLLPYLAYAYAKLANGNAVYDVSSEKLMTIPDLQDQLKTDKNARRPEMHLQTIWKRTENGGRAETRGLIKKGIPELVTHEVHHDEKILVTNLLDEAGRSLWGQNEFPSQVEVESFNDVFRLMLAPPRNGRSQVRIMRVQTT